MITPSPIRAVLMATTAAATLSATGFVAAQDAYPVSGDQFGYGKRAVAETSFNLEMFGGGDENGGTFGGAPSLTIPLGDKLGLQVDGVAGVTADEAGFAGGAAQLFYRDPQKGLIGVAGGGYYVESVKQYAVAGIAEYYLDNITLEGLVGYQTGDVMDSAYGRVGVSIYANPNLRLGGGVSYSEETKVGGDVQVEALLTDVPGLALYATGVFDEYGTAGYGGVRFYFNSGTNLLSTDRTKQASSPTLIDMHRNLGRPNFLTSGGAGFGLRQISLVGAATNGGDGFGDITPPPPPPPPPPVTSGHGIITSTMGAVDNLLNGSVLQPVGRLVNGLINPNTGLLRPITGALETVTNNKTGALDGLTDVVDALVDPKDGLLDPTLDAVNNLLSPGTKSTLHAGLIDVVQGTVNNLLGGSILQPVAGLVNALVDPHTGLLSPITAPLNMLTEVGANPLGDVTEIVYSLVGANGGLLDATLDAVNDLLSPGTKSTLNAGLIDVVQGTVDNLLGGSILQPVDGLVNGLVDPQTGLLRPITAPLNTVTEVQTSPLGGVTEIVYSLVGANGGILDRTLDGVNNLLTF